MEKLNWTIEIGYPPSINNRIKYNFGNSRYSKSGKKHAEKRKAFKKEVWAIFKSSNLHGWGKKTLKVSLELYLPDKRHRDIDACLKEVLDALQDAGAYDDDYQIRKLTVERMEEVVKTGKIIVVIEEC